MWDADHLPWQPNRASESEFCNGPTANHRRQEAQAKVRITDGQATKTKTVTFTAAAAQRCDDWCTAEDWFGTCWNDEIQPHGCGYCQPNTRQERYVSPVSGKSVGMSVIRIVTGLSASVDGAAVIHVANASGRPGRKCETRREYAYRTVNTGDTSCNDQWSVWGLISLRVELDPEVLVELGPWCLR